MLYQHREEIGTAGIMMTIEETPNNCKIPKGLVQFKRCEICSLPHLGQCHILAFPSHSSSSVAFSYGHLIVRFCCIESRAVYQDGNHQGAQVYAVFSWATISVTIMFHSGVHLPQSSNSSFSYLSHILKVSVPPTAPIDPLGLLIALGIFQ